MPKYWGKQIFSLGRFLEVGQKQKTEKERKRKRDQKLVITMASNTTSGGACKASWAKIVFPDYHDPFVSELVEW